MNEILFVLMLVSKVPGMPDQQLAMFNNRSQCMVEAKNVIEQGASAYCAPTNKPVDPVEALSKMTSIMKIMIQQMDKEFK